MKPLGRLLESSEGSVEEVFVIAFHAMDGGVDDFDGCAVLLEDAVADAPDGGLTGFGIADDSTLADVLAAGLELGLDEDDGGALPGLVLGAECAEDRREDEGSRDEGDVHSEEGWRWL
jgi:hypothetical protein